MAAVETSLPSPADADGSPVTSPPAAATGTIFTSSSPASVDTSATPVGLSECVVSIPSSHQTFHVINNTNCSNDASSMLLLEDLMAHVRHSCRSWIVSVMMSGFRLRRMGVSPMCVLWLRARLFTSQVNSVLVSVLPEFRPHMVMPVLQC